MLHRLCAMVGLAEIVSSTFKPQRSSVLTISANLCSQGGSAYLVSLPFEGEAKAAVGLALYVSRFNYARFWRTPLTFHSSLC